MKDSDLPHTGAQNGKKALIESNRKLRTLVSNLPGVVYRCLNDSKRTIEYISQGCFELTGYSADQFYHPDHVKWVDFIHKDDQEKVHNKLQLALSEKQQFHLNYRIVDAEGSIRWVSEHGMGIADKSGRIIRVEGFIEDITKQKEVEEVLKSRNRALNAAEKGIVISDAKMERFPIVYVNEAFERITGYKRQEVFGKNCDFLQNGDKKQQGIKIVRAALRNGEACKVVVRNYRKDGTLFWNELSITPVRNDDGELTHFIAVQNDITERIKQEWFKDSKNSILEMIVAHEPLEDIALKIVELLENSLDDSYVAILMAEEEMRNLKILAAPRLPSDFVHALNGIVIDPKSCSCGIAAHLKKEILVADMAKEDSWRQHKAFPFRNDLKACWSFPMLTHSHENLGALSVYSKKVKTPNSEEKKLINEVTQLASLAIEQNNVRTALQDSRDQLKFYAQELEKTVEKRTADLSSTVTRLEALNTDLETQIQERKIAEERAKTSEAIFSVISKNFPKGVIILINKDMEIVYIEGTALTHIRKQKKPFERIHIDDLANFSKKRKAIIKDHVRATLEGTHLSFEIIYRRRSYMVNSTPLRDRGNGITHALMVFHDISEHKKAEQNIRTALKKEQELNDLKSRFISTASHEFRTPLSVILSSATLIERQNETGKEEARLKHTNRIKSNVQNLVVILNDFLSLGKLEEGAITPNYQWFDLLILSEAILAEMEVNKKAGQTLEIISSAPDIQVFLDPKLMRHILNNLLSNAVKYSDENQPVILRIEKDQESVSIEIIDQGIGIPKEEQQNLFQRFFRAKNSLNIHGTGLGLHIVKQYTELMGGNIRVKSEEGEGSTFRVSFPVSKKKNKVQNLPGDE
ncbi:MAG: PAS domain S-box protein [Flavobacteriaceae bacterium]|nr:PAS domain S-box protein [Muriicola sp.]NNL38613.1 PAS domain S-box protein [Flavobacteriaceae bacterium]